MGLKCVFYLKVECDGVWSVKCVQIIVVIKSVPVFVSM